MKTSRFNDYKRCRILVSCIIVFDIVKIKSKNKISLLYALSILWNVMGIWNTFFIPTNVYVQNFVLFNQLFGTLQMKCELLQMKCELLQMKCELLKQ